MIVVVAVVSRTLQSLFDVETTTVLVISVRSQDRRRWTRLQYATGVWVLL